MRPGTLALGRAPHDEVGTPDDAIARCDCGVLFRCGESHRCEAVGEWVSWEVHRLRTAYGRAA